MRSSISPASQPASEDGHHVVRPLPAGFELLVSPPEVTLLRGRPSMHPCVPLIEQQQALHSFELQPVSAERFRCAEHYLIEDDPDAEFAEHLALVFRGRVRGRESSQREQDRFSRVGARRFRSLSRRRSAAATGTDGPTTDATGRSSAASKSSPTSRPKAEPEEPPTARSGALLCSGVSQKGQARFANSPMAVPVGFEPTVELPPHMFSRHDPSAARTRYRERVYTIREAQRTTGGSLLLHRWLALTPHPRVSRA